MTAIAGRDWDIGAPVRGYHWATSAPRGRVLLQHGYGEYAERFVTRYHELIPNLHSRGLDVYAIDLPGHGHSVGRRGSIDVRIAAQHHLAAKRILAADGPVFLFGHSLGGLVTAHTVVQDAAEVAGVILTSAALPKPPGLALQAMTGVLTTVAPHAGVPLRGVAASTLSRLPENAELYASDPLIYQGKLTNLTARTSLLAAMEMWRGIARWSAPCLILHGSDDSSTQPDGSRDLYRRIPSHDKTLEIVEGGRHELLNDIDRDRLLKLMLDWIDSRIIGV
jgi:acylglycerol lipase